MYDYYDAYYPQFLEIQLPTGDMIEKALPEGVLMPGGQITGFLYFENVDSDVPTVDFTMLLVESVDGDGAPFGTIRIPFTVEYSDPFDGAGSGHGRAQGLDREGGRHRRFQKQPVAVRFGLDRPLRQRLGVCEQAAARATAERRRPVR